MVPVTKGALVHAVVYLALAALIMDTRRGELDAPNILAKVAELEGRLAELDGCERRPRGKGWRRRVQAAPASCTDTNTFQARTDAAMDACCPAAPGGGHRRFLQADCSLPGACPASCAATFIAYFDNCGTMLAPMGPTELEKLLHELPGARREHAADSADARLRRARDDGPRAHDRRGRGATSVPTSTASSRRWSRAPPAHSWAR